jgi:hypothetical protein
MFSSERTSTAAALNQKAAVVFVAAFLCSGPARDERFS